MSKILEASCDANGKVTVAGVEVPDAIVLSEGKQASTGVLILDGEMKKYIPSSAADIKTTIEKAIDTITDTAAALTQIATALTSISAVTGPAWAPPPTLATDVTTITSKVTSLNATKTALNTLKGALK